MHERLLRDTGAGIAGLVALVLLGTPASLAADQAPTIVFGGSSHYPPFEWLDDENRPRGFVTDLAGTIARRGGHRTEHRLMPWSRVFAALDSGEVDAVAMFASQARAQKYLFTDPFYYVTHMIYGSAEADGVVGPAALANRRVALVDEGYAAATVAEEEIELTPVYRKSIPAALRAVTGGEAHYALLARPTAERVIARQRFDVTPVGPPLWPRAYVFASPRSEPSIHRLLQRNLHLSISDGSYHDVYADWQEQLEWTQPTLAERLRQVALFAAPFAALGALALFWSWQLRRRVATSTRELTHELELRQAAEAELRHWATHDKLTSLPNRSEFARLSEAIITRDGSTADAHGTVVVIKLAELDQIIASFGYAAGEELLARFGERLAEARYPAVGHFGRGVFGIAVRDRLAPGDIVRELDRPLELERVDLDPQLKAGAATHPDHGRDFDELVRRAETALAAAVARRRGWLVFASGMDPDPDDLRILHDFRHCADNDLYAVFQPQVDLGTMQVVGAEALVRWHHPDLGLVPPRRFIPLLERAGITIGVTKRMIRSGVAAAVAFRRAGTPITISINVAAADITEGDLDDRVAAELQAQEAMASDLRIEMTETSVIQDPDRAREVVASLSRRGVRCSIDDFGVGYSSLSYLSEFSIDEIKIDRRFVGDMTTNRRHDTIVRSTIDLAHALGISALAEGVESPDAVDALKAARCDRVQGFAFAQPMTRADVSAMIGSPLRPVRADS